MLFTQSGAAECPLADLHRRARGKQFTFPLSAFDGTDGHDVTAILFVGGPQAGKVNFQIDDIHCNR